MKFLKAKYKNSKRVKQLQSNAKKRSLRGAIHIIRHQNCIELDEATSKVITEGIKALEAALNKARQHKHTCYSCDKLGFRGRGSIPRNQYACDTCGSNDGTVRGVPKVKPVVYIETGYKE